jgi:hypothetical protein
VVVEVVVEVVVDVVVTGAPGSVGTGVATAGASGIVPSWIVPGSSRSSSSETATSAPETTRSATSIDATRLLRPGAGPAVCNGTSRSGGMRNRPDPCTSPRSWRAVQATTTSTTSVSAPMFDVSTTSAPGAITRGSSSGSSSHAPERSPCRKLTMSIAVSGAPRETSIRIRRPRSVSTRSTIMGGRADGCRDPSARRWRRCRRHIAAATSAPAATAKAANTSVVVSLALIRSSSHRRPGRRWNLGPMVAVRPLDPPVRSDRRPPWRVCRTPA